MSTKPFKDQGNYIAVHGAVFDRVMPFTPPNAFKVLMFVLRKTRGWHKEEDRISRSQIKAGTGIKSDDGLDGALTWLTDKALIIRRDKHGPVVNRNADRTGVDFALNRGFELHDASPKNGVVASPKNGQTTNKVSTPSDTNVSSGGADAPATDEKQDVADVMKNPGGYFCALLKTGGHEPTDRERERCFVHLKQLITKHDATRPEMEKIVAKAYEAHVNGFDWWPHDMLRKMRNNVVSINGKGNGHDEPKKPTKITQNSQGDWEWGGYIRSASEVEEARQRGWLDDATD